MMLHDPSITSRSLANASAESNLPPRHDVTGLARAFAGAQRTSIRVEETAARASISPFPELVRAVHEFVRARRADSAPPERVLAAIKGVTRACTADCVDESRVDRLQDLVLREFLVSYYDIAAPAPLIRKPPV
jgi:hypothetical protein